MFNGYMHFGGTEIANAARTQAYLDNIVPRFGFESCWDAEGLDCIIGDAPYRSPILDPAPWYNEARPASGKFFGFYPLSVVGVEDDSRSVTVTELTQDGAVFSMPRKASKEFRVSGLLMAEDGEGIDAGMAWLRGALNGAECRDGDCTGDTFCYLAYLPTCCNYEDKNKYPLVPVNWKWSKGATGPWTAYKHGFISSSQSNGMSVVMPCPDDGVQLHMEGLIPGQWYRAIVELASPTRMKVEVGGNISIAAKRENEHFPDKRNPWVLDFQAKAETETLRVVSDEPHCVEFTSRIYAVKVERTAARLTTFLPRFTSERYSEPSSWEMIGTPPPKRSVSIDGPGSPEELSLSWVNDTATTQTIPAGQGARRMIRGLNVGDKYIIYINTALSIGGTLDIKVDDVQEYIYDLGNNWYQVSFRAKKPQHYLELTTKYSHPLPPMVGSTYGQVDIDVWYLRVDIAADELYMAPVDQMSPALRSLHNVTLLDGPNLIEEYGKQYGAMRTVEFSMAVGEPSIYGEMVEVLPLPYATTYLVGNQKCQQGLPVRHNLHTNPTLFGEPIGSVPIGGFGTHAAVTSSSATTTVQLKPAFPPHETTATYQAARIVPTGAASNSSMAISVDEIGDLKKGHIYTVSATFTMTKPQVQEFPALHSSARRITVFRGGAEVMSEQAINVAGHQRLSVTFTYDGGTNAVRFYNGSSLPEDIVYWSDFLFEESGVAGTAFSGDSGGASWDGPDYASPSTWADSTPIYINDPACPDVPHAPQPPGITPDCVRDVSEWRRYWMEIPPELAGGWRESVPIIKLSTSSASVSDIRVQFHANPMELDLGQIDPCGSCGEFYISYIPGSTVMTIDGIRQKVTANVAGRGNTNAMYLASDRDYGPVRWPTLTCDLYYYMTIDIAPKVVQDLDIRLSVAMRE